MALYWCDYKYNFFHLPTSAEAQSMGNYSAPPLYWFLEDLMFALCPGLFLQVLTIGTGDALGAFMWVLAALLNGPIYYCVGLILVAVMKRFSGSRRIPNQN